MFTFAGLESWIRSVSQRIPHPTINSLQTSEPTKDARSLTTSTVRFGVAAVAAAASAVLCHVLHASIGFRFVFIAFYPAVIVVSVLAGAAAGALTTLLSACCAAYILFWEPNVAVSNGRESEIIALLIFLAGGLALAGIIALSERQSRENASRFRGWLEATPDGIVLVNGAGAVVFANRLTEKLFGYRNAELLGQPIENLIPHRFKAAHHTYREGYSAAPGPRVMGTALTIYGLRKDGSEFPADISLNPVNFGGQLLICAIIRDITGRIKTEQELRTSEERFRVALKNSPVVVFNQDLDLRYTWINNPVFVWAEQGWLGKTDADILEPESAARLTAIKRRVLETGRATREEVQVSQSGKTVYYDLTVEPLRNTDGQVIGITCASTDITDRKAAEQAIRERDAQLNAFFDSSPAGMALLSSDLRYLRVNEPLAQINGRRVDEHLGKTIEEVLPLLAPTVKPMFEKIIANGESFLNMEVKGEVAGAPNETRNWLVSYFPVKDSNGKPTAAGGVVIDITAKKRLEDALRKERDFVEALLENLAEGIVACDAEGRLTQFNRASQEIHGVPKEDVPPNKWAEHYFIYEPGQQTHANMKELPLFRALQGERVKDAEFMVVTKGGDHPRYVSVSGGPIVDSEEHRLGAVIAMRDITEHKKLEEQLLQAQKLDAIGRLAGGIAHDFNNIMGIILGYTELLNERFAAVGATREIAAIRQAADRAVALTRQLLAFSRKQVMQPQVINMNPMISELSNMLRRLIGENIELVLRTDPGLGMVKVDRMQMEQVLMNIVVNARDAMPKGGKLTITTANVTLDESHSRTFRPLKPGNYVLVSVADTGAGMDAQTRSRIFEPFFTSKGLGKGTGLGLSIVYGIVTQSGGHIEVDSEIGKGTDVKIYLPWSLEKWEPDTRQLTSVLHENVVSTSAETILVVEDERELGDVTSSLLQSRGYRVLVASSPEQALNIARTYEGEIHLLLSDVILAGQTNGVDLSVQLHEIRPQMKVLFMSGYNDVLVGGIGSGKDYPLLEKPFTSEQLSASVLKALGKE